MRYRRLRIPGGTYFFSVVTAKRLPLLANAEAVSDLMRICADVAKRHPVSIEAYVVLPDHLHMIWKLPEGDSDFSTRWMLIKSAFARKHRAGVPVWQNRFWEHLVRDDREHGSYIEYIHYNPVKHGLCGLPKDWAHSSFHAYVARGDYPADWGSGEMPKWPDEIERRSE